MERKHTKDLGKKLKVITVDKRLQRRVLITLLVLANICLFAALCYFAISIKGWGTIVIAAVLFVFCVLRSVQTIIGSKNYQKFTVYEKGISLKSIWYNQRIFYEEMLMVRIKETFWDKIFNAQTKSLEIFLISNKKSKIILPFINGDIQTLSVELMGKIMDSRIKTNNTEIIEVKKEKK